ncbi:GNAT family N-acetyltransferase [Cellulomonas fimi]|uniref:GNAT family N-acetyltransferase n=1 Tax=Cellulomonas fimi TaxID=1708 RepID=UPI00234D1FC3|nr:GNAT family N-acetyltransferase [Cellulomonas fimi]MDC7121055.1 GNAT family N-acetyltransferase [Cellulomonas fimi]
MAERWLVREAADDDVAAVCAFGDRVVRAHYAPLIGDRAATAQVEQWWTPQQIGGAVAAGLVTVAEHDGEIVGVAQRGRHGDDHVLYKLYLDAQHRGAGLGPRLVDAVVRHLPAGTRRLCVEHFAGNARAGAFYERERSSSSASSRARRASGPSTWCGGCCRSTADATTPDAGTAPPGRS